MKGKVTSRAYEQLTPQEIRDLKLVFDVFDTDKSGLVQLLGLVEMLHPMALSLMSINILPTAPLVMSTGH